VLEGVAEVPFRALQQEQGRSPPVPAAKHTGPRSAAGAVGAANRTRVDDRAHPLGRRTTRQNGGPRPRDRSAERHVGIARQDQSPVTPNLTFGAGWDNPEPSFRALLAKTSLGFWR
jgi:hypothetical protein